ncbi:DUF3306 domain-containing protein [Oceaniglobus ichthyenteri]|uniref:DUF3306 domain-containing protein n=1 Tax=Oceaniglobus ichthyenteri TaxID=2136177 RepID=UPI000D3B226C|nr:DUF3306 domain-containing protein [Oceaniglobus ichthyenteri]
MTNHLSYWDRRRAAVRAEQAEEARIAEAEHQAQIDAASEAEPDEAVLARLNLPDPDTLKMGDDFAAFMAKGVPLRLRNRALRKLWRSNPVLACVDGLNDYDDDYLTGSTGNGVIATTYQVGKGMLAHIEALARKAEACNPEEDPSEHIAEDDAVEPAPEAETEAPADMPVATAETAPEPAPAPRRMRFRFDQEASV